MAARWIFLAGASGAVGTRLTMLLREAGHFVIGTTRSATRANDLLAIGALPAPSASAPVHVDAAAFAALLAIDRGEPGAFNIAEPNAHVNTEKAVRELGWSADFRAGRAAGR
jgi:nucleoside-diphosphate-sugar epimerase